MKELTTEQFLKDVADHEMKIVRDDDACYRHIKFRSPKSCVYWFDLVTWPGSLCIDGDMGTYVFRCVPDMFQFFRKGDTLEIDTYYWTQKIMAADRNSGISDYDPDLFREKVVKWLEDAFEDEGGVPESLMRTVKRDVLSRADDGELEAMRAAMEFHHEGFQFHDFWEVNVKRLSNKLVWCLYAIAWGVQQYDKAKADVALAVFHST